LRQLPQKRLNQSTHERQIFELVVFFLTFLYFY
jgi:hypothetical protein